MLAAALRLPAPPPPPLPLRRPPAPMASLRADAKTPAAPPNRPALAAAPQPPEKPLPGDCCGSGCVRCVWDIYYEELEAYQKSLSSSSSGDKTHKPDDAKNA